MDFAEQLRVLQAAQGDPAKLALATVDLAYPALPDTERAALKEALAAAAIPHWCDEAILAALLEISPEDSAVRLARLRGLTVVEPFPARGNTAVNVHESARLALRKQIAGDGQAVARSRSSRGDEAQTSKELAPPDVASSESGADSQRDQFRRLSARAVECFKQDSAPAKRIEWIYHLLCAEPERGASELENLDREWGSSAHPEDRYALAAALRELDNSGVVHGRARAWALLTIAWAVVSRGETTQQAEVGENVLRLAREAKDQRAEADAQCLRGDVLVAQGKLAEAQAAFEEYLAISRRLAEQDPSNAGCQRRLAAAHSRMSDVFVAQGNVAEAQAMCVDDLAISLRLAAQEPSNSSLQHDLGVAHSRMGGVLEAQGKLAEALVAFGEHLAIRQRLAAQEPSNACWQRELAVAHSRLGGVLEAQGRLVEALSAFQARMEISRSLVELDPTNAEWQSGLAVAHKRLGGVFQAQRKLIEARAAFEESLGIRYRLARQYPLNADAQRGLAVAYRTLAALEFNEGQHEAALPLYQEAARIIGELAVKCPGFAQWAKDKQQVETELALCLFRVQASQPSRSPQTE